jgi:N utilization substance protein B
VRRRQARELVMKALYQRDVGHGRPSETLRYLCEEEAAEPDTAGFAERLLTGVLDHLADVDRRIAGYARDWRLERLANVDRNILRLGVYELFWGEDAPPSVAISEAVEMAKVYGGPESGRFINGVLGQMARDRAAEEAGPGHAASDAPSAHAAAAPPGLRSSAPPSGVPASAPPSVAVREEQQPSQQDPEGGRP